MDMEQVKPWGPSSQRQRHAHTYRECAADQAGSSFRVWISWYYTTGGYHGYRSLAANLTHLVRQTLNYLEIWKRVSMFDTVFNIH